MKSLMSLCCSALLAAVLTVPAFAQQGPGMDGMSGMAGMTGMTGMGPGMGGGGPAAGKRPPRDCAQAPNPEQCKARQEARTKATEACKDKAGPARRQCMHDHMPPADCAKSRNPQRCEVMQKAHETCKDKVGPDRRQCMGEAMKAK